MNVNRLLLRELAFQGSFYVAAAMWLTGWGVLGLRVWQPYWWDWFGPYTTEVGIVAWTAHAFGLVGFIGGVAVGTVIARWAHRRYFA